MQSNYNGLIRKFKFTKRQNRIWQWHFWHFCWAFQANKWGQVNGMLLYLSNTIPIAHQQNVALHYLQVIFFKRIIKLIYHIFKKFVFPTCFHDFQFCFWRVSILENFCANSNNLILAKYTWIWMQKIECCSYTPAIMYNLCPTFKVWPFVLFSDIAAMKHVQQFCCASWCCWHTQMLCRFKQYVTDGSAIRLLI